MTRATREQAVALLSRLRTLVRRDADASLSDVVRARGFAGFPLAYSALCATNFYSLSRSRPAMVRAVTRAIAIARRRQ